MTGKFLYLIAALALIGSGCNGNAIVPEQPDETETLPPTAKVPVSSNWVFDGKPELTVIVENPNALTVNSELNAQISTDKNKKVTTINETVQVSANGTLTCILTTKEQLEPGFYIATIKVDGKTVRKFNFGINPSEIVSAPDKQSDFDEFWAAAKEQLDGIEMNAELTEITSRSSAAQKAYLVQMQSVPDNPDSEPVTVRGYYFEPQDGKKHPVLIHFFGYDTEKNPSAYYCPYGNAEYAEFYLSTRGQMINNRSANKRTPDGKGDFVNTYGDWFAFNFGQKDGYYYRGAFMDCVQAVRFMASRPTSDMDNLFAEGSSQGGAFCYAAAALSDFPFNAIAPCVAFLGDFPDYFDIVSWPGNTAKNNKGSMSTEEMFKFLSYFDTKNLATRIDCSVIACSGLQDGTCPPHTNTAPFNNLPVDDKEMYYYPEMKHEIPGDWEKKYTAFFKKRIK